MNKHGAERPEGALERHAFFQWSACQRAGDVCVCLCLFCGPGRVDVIAANKLLPL